MAAIQSAPNGAQHVDDARRLIAQRIVDSRGHSYVVVVRFPEPSVLNRSLVEFLSPRRSGRWIGPVGGMRVLFVLLVGGVFCFLLTRHLSRPIEQLRWATGNIASEQLQTRVDPGVLRRHDELADLGRDFNRMANRIEQLVTAQRQLLADVSHALQSPLARSMSPWAWRAAAATRPRSSTSIASSGKRSG